MFRSPLSDHHDGLAHDLPRLFDRRGLLALLGGAGAFAAAGPAAACTALPWETAGPYPADGSNGPTSVALNALSQSGILREDLRPSFNGMTDVAEGVRLELRLTLTDATGCTPLAGHAIYLWHCNAIGFYSLYDRPEANWLRGLGVANADGVVRFTTIVPGCYAGRWPHMHFEVFRSPKAAVSGDASVLTAQIALPHECCAAVYDADPRYANGRRNLFHMNIGDDNVFGDNSADEVAQQTLSITGTPEAGFLGTVTIPVDFDADRTLPMPPPRPQRG